MPPLVDILLARIELISGAHVPAVHAQRPMPDYEPDVLHELPACRPSSAACTALEAMYDHLAEGDGGNLIYFPIFNYNDGSLDTVRQHAGSIRARCSR